MPIVDLGVSITFLFNPLPVAIFWSVIGAKLPLLSTRLVEPVWFGPKLFDVRPPTALILLSILATLLRDLSMDLSSLQLTGSLVRAGDKPSTNELP